MRTDPSRRTTTPRSTYRLQLHGGFSFDDAAAIVGHLADLGTTHLYLSPILQARPGSTHGYDVADPTRVSEVLGGEDGLRRLAGRAHAAGLGIVVDVVPNHLGTGAATPLWMQLLGSGQAGEAGRFFDVDWATPLPGAAGKVIVPVLGEPYGDVLSAGKLELVADEASGTVELRYFDHRFPLSSESLAALERAGGPGALRGEPAEPESWSRLHALLEQQHYRLVHWRAGPRLINYRRFFSINELAGVRIEDERVFNTTHETLLRLVDDGTVDGLRIDHPDGLRDPARYLQRLAERTGGAWVVVEKITERGERLPGWPVAGTTGYEFANDMVQMQCDPAGVAALDRLDGFMGASAAPYTALAARAKREVVTGELAADVERVARALWAVTAVHLETRDVDLSHCRTVVGETLVALDVYRTYVDPQTGEASPEDLERIDVAIERAGRAAERLQAPRPPARLFAFLADVLAGRAGTTADHLEVLARFQQLSGAVTAKGVEDTVFYRYRRLLALNEVGGDPSEAGMDVAAFHRVNLERAQHHPRGLLSTATHDTKRGEDVRLRMVALSELAEDWVAAVRRWHELLAPAVTATPAGPAPDPQTQSLLLQTLVGVWPTSAGDGAPLDPGVRDRVVEYARKACREAGQRTDWVDPDAAFEDGVAQFVATLLGEVGFAEVRAELAAVAERAAEIAMASGLAQVLLRCTVPGVPDTYQGNELWDDSLVDPDNRRPVDHHRRAQLLRQLDAEAPSPRSLWVSRRDGRVKLWVLSRALRARNDLPDAVGADGRYVPLQVTGRWAAHVVAFARVAPDGARLVTVAPRLPGALLAAHGGVLAEAWEDTAVLLGDLAGRLEDRLAPGRVFDGAALRLADVLAELPVALLAR